jgi:Predicted archaeal kinase
VLLIKLGGSVITDKKKNEYLIKRNTLRRLAYEINASGKRVIVVHGAGPFGHRKVKELPLRKSENINDVVKVQQSTRILNTEVLKILDNAGLNPISFPPYSLFKFSSGKLVSKDFDLLSYYFKNGFTPVIYGDICFDSENGYHICSGDESMLELVKFFNPDKAIFVTDVDGILDRSPESEEAKLLDRVSNMSEISFSKGRVDVTGGMEGKFEIMLEISKFCGVWVINGKAKHRLLKSINGKRVKGTEVFYEEEGRTR